MSTAVSFNQQQNVAAEAAAAARHPSQRAKDMDDTEKIYHLQQEIENLRTQIRTANGGSLNAAASASSSTSSNSAAGMSSLSFPVMTVGLLLAVVLVGLWRRTTGGRRRGGGTSGRGSYSGLTTFMNGAGAGPRGGRFFSSGGEEMTMSFELPDAHESYANMEESSSAAAAVAASYAAPSAEIQFV